MFFAPKQTDRLILFPAHFLRSPRGSGWEGHGVPMLSSGHQPPVEPRCSSVAWKMFPVTDGQVLLHLTAPRGHATASMAQAPSCLWLCCPGAHCRHLVQDDFAGPGEQRGSGGGHDRKLGPALLPAPGKWATGSKGGRESQSTSGCVWQAASLPACPGLGNLSSGPVVWLGLVGVAFESAIGRAKPGGSRPAPSVPLLCFGPRGLGGLGRRGWQR